ncbi:aminotransferase class V-fold PLP-dependent enzyme [Cellvibrio sp. KY-YJ-3]|uniref:aminotransferase class V-fold PLP-dependent enzyme n=1 Tax=Cellvibrio sp. KY-YJ-3 TaxID=454662 RepID=UPI0012457AE5|nr:aminotransferase class V-fold PLP-dependent enzyme [Cellvibrio sp. KY-YJ-3]QEY13519.1 aminotransferase class V-fold PLP-dependent enzyme [Cellvibrio sp. KY-YJ-3]
MRKPVYLDYAATTPVAPEVAALMAQCLTLEGTFANPASRSHVYGWQAEELVEEARAQVAQLINADPREIVWTSGATEANNLALKGIAESYRANNASGGHIVVSAIEHKAVLDPASWLETQGFGVTRLLPDSDGIVTVDALAAALQADTFLVSIMQVNNELGCINDIKSLAAICGMRGILFHCDAAQSAGKIALDVKDLGVDLLSLSAHKFYGPKGVGALYVKRAANVKVAAQIHGGGHERGMRSGTLATHQLVGIGAAAKLAQEHLVRDAERIKSLRDHLWQALADLPGVKRNGSSEFCVSGILNVAFGNTDGEMLLLSLRDLAISSGSACNSASMSPSYVLKAIGLSDENAQASLRFSIGRYTTAEEIEFAIEHLRSVISKLHKA